MRTIFDRLLRDLKTIYTEAWFFPDEKFDTQAAAWYKVLKGFNYDQLRKACDEYIKENSQPPTAPAQIRDYITRGSQKSDPLEGFVLWEARDRTTGLRVCQDILASPKDTAEDILNYIGQAVDISNVTLRRTTS